jgi:thiamine-phosphate pyrophosphorylase
VGGDRYTVNKVYRIIDANLNRAVEGLRVMEEVARFELENKKLTDKVKGLRGKVRGEIKLDLLSRDVKGDVGRELYHEKESKRNSIKDIFAANAKRVQEALRVLEEFSKLVDPKHGKKFKAFRFEAYAIEKKVFPLLLRGK